jgi:competence protein ComEC
MRPDKTARKSDFSVLRDMLALAILLAVTLPFAFREHTRQQQAPILRVTFLDVGKGDAAVIETPSGKVVVVDTGGKLGSGAGDHGSRTIAPFLRAHGKERIAFLLLTHPHPDHISGAVSLLNAFPVAGLVDNGVAADSAEVRRYRQAAQDRNVRLFVGARGTTISLGDGVVLRLVAPPRATAAGRVNNSSIVVCLEYGKTAFLLTGDAEAESEGEMIAADQNLACNVLKVGHHGSNASTSAALLSAAHPQIAVISVNANNSAGYPHPELLDRLRAARARVYRTDQNGNVTCLSDGTRIRVETQR